MFTEESGVDKTAEGAGGGILDSEAVGGVDNVSLHLTDHSTYARNKLAYLQERLNNKLLVSMNYLSKSFGLIRFILCLIPKSQICADL